MGDDQLWPGISAFQATFSVVVQRSGKAAVVTPRALSPRNWDQLAAFSARAEKLASSTDIHSSNNGVYFILVKYLDEAHKQGWR
jgi:hypothetical protein